MVAAVRTRADFTALSRSRTRRREGDLWLRHAPRAAGDPEPVRVAYAIPGAVGTAVVRNRLRRRLRARVDELRRADRLPAGRLLIGARPGAEALGWAELGAAVSALVADLPTVGSAR